MKPLKPSNTTLKSMHALAKTRSAPKEIRKLSQEYANPVSEDIERVEDLVGAIYKKSIGCFITQPISLGACLLKANQDQAFYDMAIQPGSNYIEKLESASKIECPASRDCAFMAVANDYGDDAHFDGLLEAARNHKDVATMQAFFKVIATDSTTNFFRAIKATKELTNLEEQQTILKDFYQDAKQKTYTAAPLLEIAKLTLDAALKETILFDAIAQPSLNKYDFKAQLTAYSLLSDKSQSPRTRLQILEDFFNPQFVHICSTLENGYRTTYDWLTDDLFSSLQDKEIDLVVRGLARSVPGPNNMDDKTQIHALNELSQKIVHFFGDNWELTTFMAALLYHPTIHFIALRTIIGRYLKDKSFDALLNCFQYLTQQAPAQPRYDPYALMWVCFCLNRSTTDTDRLLFQGTMRHTMGQGSCQWDIMSDRLPDARDIQLLVSSEDLECLAACAAIDSEARKYLIHSLHKREDSKEARDYFLKQIDESPDKLRLQRVKALPSQE